MVRKLLIILSVFFCVNVFAQEAPNVVVVHQQNDKAGQVAIADIDSIDFPDAMRIHLKSGEKQLYDYADIEWIDFAIVPETELYEAVDLGLSVRWAAFNIGATKPEEVGDLFSWGETSTKKSYSEAAYAYYKNEQYEYIGVNICGTKYDAARQSWGGLWRLPTRSEIADLTSKCTWKAETLNGVKGYRVTGVNGNSIFLPAAGYQDGTERKEVGTGGFYWSGSLNRNMTSSAYNINFRGYDAEWTASRAYGFSVRAVK